MPRRAKGLFRVGDICVKIAGRESGRRCVIVDVIDKDFVLVTGPKDISGVRRRKANIDHLYAIGKRIKIKRGASDEEVREALEQSGLLEEMRKRVVPQASS